MLPLDINVRHDGREQQEFFVWMSEHNLGCCFCVCIWPGVLCCICIAGPLRCVGFLGGEGRTSAQRKNGAGPGHSVECWLLWQSQISQTSWPGLCVSGVALSMCSAGMWRASLVSAGLRRGLAVSSIALYRCFWISRNLGCCGNQILGSLVVRVPCLAGLNLF